MRLVKSSQGRQRGIVLAEVLVYLAVWFAVLGVAMGVFYQFWDASKALQRRTDDLIAALRSGETWREDIRRAAGPVGVSDENGGQLLSVPTAAGAVEWYFAEGQVWRRAGSSGTWVRRAARVRGSRFALAERHGVRCAVWELELQPPRPRGRPTVPLAFFAVPPETTVPPHPEPP